MHYLAEVTNEDKDLHIYINSDKFTSKNCVLCMSYDGKVLSYSTKSLENIDCIDTIMGLIGRDTQNWFYNNIVIHWGVNSWKFYNAHNIEIFSKEELEMFDIRDYDAK